MHNKEEDYSVKLHQMVLYIEQDGHEKAEEIDVIAVEEYNLEKKRHLDNTIINVKRYYDNLEQKCQQQTIVEISKIKSKAYQDFLHARTAIIDEVFNIVRSRLLQVTNNQNECLYKKVLYQLIIQGLFQMMESNIIVKVRKQDLQLAQKITRQAEEFFRAKTKMSVKLVVDPDHFLSDACGGGIEMMNSSKGIILNNTLNKKLELFYSQMKPEIRKALFGVNPNRVHVDVFWS